MATREALINDYRKNMRMLLLVMGLNWFVIVVSLLIVVNEELSEQMGMGGIVCLIAWILAIFLVSFLFMLVVVKWNEDAATVGVILAGLYCLGCATLVSGILKPLFLVPPALLAALVIRMHWLTYKIARTPPMTSTAPPYGVELPGGRR